MPNNYKIYYTDRFDNEKTFTLVASTAEEARDTARDIVSHGHVYAVAYDKGINPYEPLPEDSEQFKEGARYVLEYLQELFEGIEQTDIWADFMEVSE